MSADKQTKIPGVDMQLLRLFGRYVKLETAEKLSIATSFLIVALVMFALGTSAVFFLSTGLVKSLSSYFGDEALANYVVGGVLLLIIVIFYIFRVRLVENRVVASISASVLKAENDDDEEEEEGGDL